MLLVARVLPCGCYGILGGCSVVAMLFFCVVASVLLCGCYGILGECSVVAMFFMCSC